MDQNGNYQMRNVLWNDLPYVGSNYNMIVFSLYLRGLIVNLIWFDLRYTGFTRYGDKLYYYYNKIWKFVFVIYLDFNNVCPGLIWTMYVLIKYSFSGDRRFHLFHLFGGGGGGGGGIQHNRRGLGGSMSFQFILTVFTFT